MEAPAASPPLWKSAQNSNSSAPGSDDVERIDPKYAALLFYLLLFLLIVAQSVLFTWRKRHPRSYDLVTLVGLWLMPAIISLHLHFWRFLGVWALYTLGTGYLLYLVMHKRTDHSVPRKVYTWFLGVYRVSVAFGMLGYIMLLTSAFGADLLYDRILPKGTALVILWYGLYFGILGRDCAEVASDRMALMHGGGRRLGASVHACGMCGGELKDFSHLGEQQGEEVERVVQLSCKHSFHDLCIRGWTIVGKKDVCPVCLEKVDLKDLYANRPWETSNLSWLQMLDALRYVIVWNPVILGVFSVLAHLFPHHVHHAKHFSAKHLAQMGPPGSSPLLSPLH